MKLKPLYNLIFEKFISIPFDRDLYDDKRELSINGKDFHFCQLNGTESNVFIIEYNGEEVGRAVLDENGNYLDSIRIDPSFRRMGLASNLYKYIEEVTNVKIVPSPDKQSPEIKNFWSKK